MTVAAAVHPSLEAIGPARWSEVAAAGGLFSSHDWLRLFEGEQRMFPGLEADYVVLEEGGAPIAAAACYTARAPGSFSASVDPYKEYLAGGAPPPVAPEALFPVTLCEAPLGFSNRLLVAPAAAARRRELGATLAAKVREVAAGRGAKLAVFGHLPVDDAQALAAGADVVPAFALAEASLPLDDGFAGYLARLSHHRRDRVKAEIRHFAGEGLTFRTMRFSEVIPELVPLAVALQRKFGNEYDPAFFAGLYRRFAAGLDERSRAFCAMRDGKMIGAAVFFLHEGVYYARHWGVDPEAAPKKAALYFNCLYHEPVRAAEREGVRRIEFGLDAIEAKVSHGCDVRSLWTLFAFAGPPPPGVAEHLRRRSEERIAEQVAALEGIGRDRARIENELQLAGGRTLGAVP